MTDKSEQAFNDLYYEVAHLKSAQYRIQDVHSRITNDIVKENDREYAKKAVTAALDPFFKKYESSIYKAAKKFVEAYEANDLVK